MPIHFEYAIEVPQSPEQAFALFDDLPRTAEWLAPCTALEKLTPGENKVGDRLKYHYREGGRTGEMDGEITIRVPNERLTCRYWDKMFEIVVDSRVTKTPNGSRLFNAIDITPKNFLFKLMAPLMRKPLAKQTINAMESLRDILAAKHPSMPDS